MKFTPDTFRPQIEAIAVASGQMSETDRQVWDSRMRLVYGEMEGQRGVDFSSFAGDLDRQSTIIALESLYCLITALISTSAFHDQPADRLRSASRWSDRELESMLTRLFSGAAYEEFGFLGCASRSPMGWLCDGDARLRASLRHLIATLANVWDDDELSIGGDDPFQEVHRQLFPSNLTHITGQFYSPEWLAEMLIADVGWKPDQTLIDPFCGSGVFLVKALRSALDQGCCVREAVHQIRGIDIHPFAVAAAQSNLALFITRHRRDASESVHLNVVCGDAIAPSMRDPRSENGQAPIEIDQADVVATNPPWVGWEYLSRPYREAIKSAWLTHDLYQSRGMEASFLKEDLSNLALLAAWDAYLRDGGRSVVVLRPATMHSEVASRGVRRLSLAGGGTPLKLERIRTFKNLRLFKSADTGAATWQIRKGDSTEFPVPVCELQKLQPRWNPTSTSTAADVLAHVRVIDKLAEPTVTDDATSRWMIATGADLNFLRRLRGSNEYTPRMGVFTGGANGVFYLRRNSTEQVSRYRNITANCRRKVTEVDVDVEEELVHSVARGRDISQWCCQPEVFMLLPHTATSLMRPIPEGTMQTEYPRSYRYLHSMDQPLRARNGFAGWEKKIHEQHFYTLQRVGKYTFAPYKVCWRYIAREFIVCVLGADEEGKTIVPNDKVMFVPFDDPDEAYFVAGFLSSGPVRRYVDCVIEKRQISTRVINSLAIPSYDPGCRLHREIAQACEQGHAALRKEPDADVSNLRDQVSRRVEQMFDGNGRR